MIELCSNIQKPSAVNIATCLLFVLPPLHIWETDIRVSGISSIINVSRPNWPKFPRSFGSTFGPKAGQADMSLQGLFMVANDSNESDQSETDNPGAQHPAGIQTGNIPGDTIPEETINSESNSGESIPENERLGDQFPNSYMSPSRDNSNNIMPVSAMSAADENQMINRIPRSLIPRQHMTMGASSSQSSADLYNHDISEKFNVEY